MIIVWENLGRSALPRVKLLLFVIYSIENIHISRICGYSYVERLSTF